MAILGIILEGIENRDFIDSRFSKLYYWSEHKEICIEKILEKYGNSNIALRMYHIHVSDKISKRMQIASKYILWGDIYASSWGRIPLILDSNSVLVKQKSTNVQRFYIKMIEEKHNLEVPKNFEIDKFNKWS